MNSQSPESSPANENAPSSHNPANKALYWVCTVWSAAAVMIIFAFIGALAGGAGVYLAYGLEKQHKTEIKAIEAYNAGWNEAIQWRCQKMIEIEKQGKLDEQGVRQIWSESGK